MAYETKLKILNLILVAIVLSFVWKVIWAIKEYQNFTEKPISLNDSRLYAYYWQAPPLYEITQYVLKGTMANNKEVEDGAIACPRHIKLGTEVEIGGIKYTCSDRTAMRYDGTFDIWQQDLQVAMEWGRRQMIVKIINP